MRLVALLIGVVVLLAGGWLVLRSLDDPGQVDERLQEAGMTTTEPVVPEVLGGGVPPSVCQADAQALETAASLYEAAEGEPATSTQDLVDERFLAEPPTYHELQPAADGTVAVVPVPGAGCD